MENNNVNIVCNENVSCELELHGRYQDLYKFTPAVGYTLWRDNETGNLDPETGEPWCYWSSISATDTEVEEFAPHIWAKLIDETMEVFCDTNPNEPEVATFSMRGRSVEPEEDSHTYIDENGVERPKRGVY